jgi:hypothetical protein
MSDGETVAEIELHNVKVARMLVAYWRRQGVEIGPDGGPTKGLRAKLGPNGLPRGYRGQDAIPVADLNHGRFLR